MYVKDCKGIHIIDIRNQSHKVAHKMYQKYTFSSWEVRNIVWWQWLICTITTNTRKSLQLWLTFATLQFCVSPSVLSVNKYWEHYYKVGINPNLKLLYKYRKKLNCFFNPSQKVIFKNFDNSENHMTRHHHGLVLIHFRLIYLYFNIFNSIIIHRSQYISHGPD